MYSATLLQLGGEEFGTVENVSVNCSVLDGVVCAGNKMFTKQNVPCLRYIVASNKLTFSCLFCLDMQDIIFHLSCYILFSWDFWVWIAFVLATLVLVLPSY